MTDTDGDHKLYYRYNVDESEIISNRTIFFDTYGIRNKGGPDGIKVDKKENCYFTGPGGVLVISPKGEYFGIIAQPELPANIARGEKDGKTIFMTCRTGLYSIQLKIVGIRVME